MAADDMELILWRHADAEDGTPDAARALSKKGREQVQAMARWLKDRLPKQPRILSSPAVRAADTAAGLKLPVTTTEKLDVGAAAADVLAAAGWPSAGGTVVVVGHQPTLGRVAALLVSGEEADWSIKKGAVWWFTSRARAGRRQVTLHAVIAPDLL
jgi:phosphohistidine phosphatase